MLQPHRAGTRWLRRGREASTGTSNPSVEQTNVSHNGWSRASFAVVGLRVPSHERGFKWSSRALALSACSPQGIHFHTKSGVQDRGFVLLGHVQQALLLEPRASVPLVQGLELGPVCGELLRETPLRRDGARRSGSWELEDAGRATRLRLYASWRRSSCGRSRVPWPQRWRPRLTAVRAGLQSGAPCSRSPAEVLHTGGQPARE